MIRLHAERDDLEKAEAVFARFREVGPVANTWIEALLDHGRKGDARHLLDELAARDDGNRRRRGR